MLRLLTIWRKGLLWMALIFAVLSCYFFIPNIFSEGVIDRVIFRYLIIFLKITKNNIKLQN